MPWHRRGSTTVERPKAETTTASRAEAREYHAVPEGGHYDLKCRQCGFIHHVPGDYSDPPVDFSVDVDHVRLQWVIGGVFTLTLGLGEFYSIAPMPQSRVVVYTGIEDNMKPLHAHMIYHFDQVFLLIRQTATRTDHEYKTRPEGPLYVRYHRDGGIDIRGNRDTLDTLDVSKAAIPGVSWKEYKCDICSKPMARFEVKRHSAATIKRAVTAGFNPYKTPGFDMSIVESRNRAVRAAAGQDVNTARDPYPEWRQMAMTDTSDWGLCPTCTQALAQAYGAFE